MENEVDIEPESTIRLKYNCLMRILEKYEIISDEELDSILNNLDLIRLENFDLKQELAELKQKAIVPKFNFNQEIYFIDEVNQIVRAIILAYDYYDKRYLARLKYFQEEQVWLYEEDIFATREEAEQKLSEIGGKDE